MSRLRFLPRFSRKRRGGENMSAATPRYKGLVLDSASDDAYADERVAASKASIAQSGITYTWEEVKARGRMRIARMELEHPRDGGASCFQ